VATHNVTFDRAKLERLKASMGTAERAGLDTFTFEGEVYSVAYAKHLVAYLDGILPKD
jgi:hypothetical protein